VEWFFVLCKLGVVGLLTYWFCSQKRLNRGKGLGFACLIASIIEVKRKVCLQKKSLEEEKYPPSKRF